MSPKQIGWIVVGFLGILSLIILPFKLLVTVGADEIIVHQGAISGEITVWSEPGLEWQNFGRIEVYKKSDQFWFGSAVSKDEEGNEVTNSKCIRARFNDGGHGEICGSLSFDLPTDQKSMAELHAKFGSQEAIESRLIRQSVNKAVYMSGPLMSSKESAGERRAELINAINDQASEGVYQTETKQKTVVDLLGGEIEDVEEVKVPKTNEEGEPVIGEDGKPIFETKLKTVKKPRTKKVDVIIPKKKDGKILVQETSAVKTFKIVLYNLAITGIKYDKAVQAQIKKQQEALMAINTAMAKAKEAEQKVLTVEKEGQANAAAAKWEQEKLKATAVTKAEQRKEVAALDLEAAKLEATANIERGRGEAEAKKLVMDADGALDKKLKAWTEVQKAYAAQIGKQRWVPEVVMGGSGGGGDPATDVMKMLQVKAAKDLALDLGMKGKR